MKRKIAVLLAGAMLMMASSAFALFMPGESEGWSTSGNIETYLGLSYFPMAEASVTNLNFNGQWKYTAIGAESGNLNLIEMPVAGVPGPGYGGPVVTFSTASTTNWGYWDIVDFNVTNLFFEDTTGPYNVSLDPYSGTSTPGFKIYRLTADSNPLTYLSGAPVFKAGTYIVGFNDNSKVGQLNDSDYDDIIVAMTPVVPEPSTMMLLGAGLLGLVICGKRRMNNND